MSKALWFILGLAAGGTGGYFVTKSYMNKITKEEINKLTERFDEELKQYDKPMRNYRESDTDGEDLQEGKKTSNRYEKIKTNYNIIKQRKEEELEKTIKNKKKEDVAVRKFDEDIDNEDEDLEELKNDDEDICEVPYVINEEEFFDGQAKFDKLSLTYYEEDDILVDECEEVIPEVEVVIGDAALTSFGIGTDDENMVYVRNDILEADYEITRNPGSYSKIVLGFK